MDKKDKDMLDMLSYNLQSISVPDYIKSITPNIYKVEGTIQTSRRPPQRQITPMTEARRIENLLKNTTEINKDQIIQEMDHLSSKIRTMTNKFCESILEDIGEAEAHPYGLHIYKAAMDLKSGLTQTYNETTNEEDMKTKASILEKLALFLHLLHDKYFEHFNNGDGHTEITREINPICIIFGLRLDSEQTN